MALSQDLRLRIVDLVASGVSRREAARQFQVSASSAIRFVRRVAEVGHVGVESGRGQNRIIRDFRLESLAS